MKLIKWMSVFFVAIVIQLNSVWAVVSTEGIKGVNNPHIWFDNQAYSALNTIRSSGFNTVRIVWSTSGSGSRLQQIISQCQALGLKPIPELHDVTGGSGQYDIDKMVNYWISIRDYIPSDVWINIANEWGPSNSTAWRDAYINGIKKLRSNWMNNTIVVDAGGWGQDDQDILNYGPAILKADQNVVFSIHMYGSWNDKNKITTFLNNCKNKAIPVMVGEFGYNYNNGSNNLSCKVDAAHVMSTCKNLGIGYIAWSWCGNNAENAWLDMTSNWGNLTTWGNLIKSFDGSFDPTANYRIVNRNSGKVLDVNGASLAYGAPVIQYWFWGGSNQQWQVINLGNGYYKIVNRNSNQLLDISGSSTSSGSKVVQWSDNNGNSQQWQIVDAGSGYYKIVNKNSGQVLDVNECSTADGASLIQWPYNNGYNQQWQLIKN
jgi:mannan endo-1,4-beta-mannosidase